MHVASLFLGFVLGFFGLAWLATVADEDEVDELLELRRAGL